MTEDTVKFEEEAANTVAHADEHVGAAAIVEEEAARSVESFLGGQNAPIQIDLGSLITKAEQKAVRDYRKKQRERARNKMRNVSRNKNRT